MKNIYKNINGIILFCVFLNTIEIYAQNWQWAKQAGGSSSDKISNICTDFSGNVYVTGTYSFIFMNTPASSISFDTITLLPVGDNQIYIAKYSSTGDVLWAKSIGGNNIIGNSNIYESSGSLSFDPFNQCIYLTGNIYGFAAFGSTTLSGYGVSFYTKMDLNGNFIWAKQFPYAFSSFISIDSDIHGNQIIYGYTSDTMQVGPNILLPGNFFALFDINGNIVFSKKISSKTLEFKTVRKDDNIYSIFSVSSNSIKIDTTQITSSTAHNFILACFDTLGSLKWHKLV
ncbi:MAG: SBBP repeat-containing protein [Bacteroidetes bacterium]|nr:SBBP repeat-containing protein [Bacteroidota bacterium]